MTSLVLVSLLLPTAPQTFVECAFSGVPMQVVFAVDHYSCEVLEGGRISCRAEDGLALSFALQLDEDECADRVFGIEYEGRLVVLFEVSGVDYGTSRAQWLDERGNTMATLEIGGFNLGEPFREGNALYVTAIGRIGRIDLEKRRWHWHHDGLYDAFRRGNSFEKPRRRGKYIEFQAVDRPSDPRETGLVTVDPETGEIVAP